MGRVLTNNEAVAYAVEASLGTLPGSPTWYGIEPNTIQNFGATYRRVARNPISKNRQRRKGTIVDLDSAVTLEGDLTRSAMLDFLEGFVFADFVGGASFVPSAVTGSDEYTVASGGALDAGTLVFARGFTNSANNGLKVVDASASSTTIPVTTTLVAEASPPTNVLLEVAGVQGASGDIEIDSNGDIISTVLDFTGLGLTAGQTIWAGGSTAGTQFATAANTGFARVMTIAANKLTVDKKATTFVADTGTSKTIQLLFGRFLRNVPTDDADFLERSYQFELSHVNLGNPSGDEYEYAKGNYCNELGFTLPLTEKSTMTFGFLGTDTPAPTSSRATNASTPVEPNATEAMNTSADIARLRITQVDETGLTTDFKSLTVNLRNGVSPEKVLAQLGAKYMNIGNFMVDLEAVVLFTDSDVITAIRNNTTVTMDFVLKNNDGGFFFDIPAMTLGGGGKDYPVNESVRLNLTCEAFEDPTLGTSVGISVFPYLP